MVVLSKGDEIGKLDKEYSTVGKQVTFDFFGISSDTLNDAFFLSYVYKIGIERCGATIRQYQQELFEPEGVTFTYILSESHASCHTYPSDRVLMGCIHTCGEHVDPNIAVDYLISVLCPKEVVRNEIVRGVRPSK